MVKTWHFIKQDLYRNTRQNKISMQNIKLKGEFIAIGRRLSTQILQIFYTSLFENNKTIEMIISLNTAKSTRHTAHLYYCIFKSIHILNLPFKMFRFTDSHTCFKNTNFKKRHHSKVVFGLYNELRSNFSSDGWLSLISLKVNRFIVRIFLQFIMLK